MNFRILPSGVLCLRWWKYPGSTTSPNDIVSVANCPAPNTNMSFSLSPSVTLKFLYMLRILDGVYISELSGMLKSYIFNRSEHFIFTVIISLVIKEWSDITLLLAC